MPDQEYRHAIELARRIATEVGTPRFYLEKAPEVALSRELFAAEPLIEEGRRIVAKLGVCLGHGLTHVEKVAVDSGALILIERGDKAPDAGPVRRLVLLAQLAGLLHDICRTEKNHAKRGAREAEKLLSSFPIRADERLSIADAIGNHEAFQPTRDATDREDRLLSDALYDADKFRWGPDNFTETLWAMIGRRGIPLQRLLPRYLQGIESIHRIRDSFRTPTGRVYGPDFIDRGLAIGRKLHAVLTAAESENY